MDATPPLIVILEDDTGLRRAIERLLTLSGFGTRTYGSADGPDLPMHASSAHCLVVDVQLPGRSGPEFYAALPDPRPPVVFITAFDGPSTRHELSRVQKYILLNKPFLGKELLEAVDAATGKIP
ncbi:response regulator [Paraburkholderia sp. Tr-20389]|uniref:response regulator n=1 Tax=Paraburkholderia sp. Tr-20389 TaxID=2703903 RepID=UPI00197DAA8A|nr:response regulator [Paraburkholderia sp. Tr-20389]MBN3752304.1 response regulator [Paraburkholderia sp. Tr-20389]